MIQSGASTENLKQGSLFETRPIFLNVVKDGSRVQMSFLEIFDPTAYDELSAVTYVSSPSFFFKAARHFKKVRLLLGIEEREHLEPFQQHVVSCLDAESLVEFWKDIDEEIRQRVCQGSISIRYTGTAYGPVHSKFYLLAEACLHELIEQMDSSLFRDFTWRLGKMIAVRGEFYEVRDPLAAARKIFHDYYGMFEFELPPWFSSGPVDDYREMGREYWQAVFRRGTADAFKEEGDKLYIYLDRIAQGKEREVAANLLPYECDPRRNANVVIVKKEPFCEFIGESPNSTRQDQVRRGILGVFQKFGLSRTHR